MTLQLFKLNKDTRDTFLKNALGKKFVDLDCKIDRIEAVNKKALKGMKKAELMALYNVCKTQTRPEIDAKTVEDLKFFFEWTLANRDFVLVEEGFTMDAVTEAVATATAEAAANKAAKRAELDARAIKRNEEKAEANRLANLKKEAARLAALRQAEIDEAEAKAEAGRVALKAIGGFFLGFFGGIAYGTAKGVSKGLTKSAGKAFKSVGKAGNKGVNNYYKGLKASRKKWGYKYG